MTDQLRIDVALVPHEARLTGGCVLIVIDQIRASTTLTAALDLGISDLFLAGDLRTARRDARRTGSLLAGEQAAVKPPGFDFDNSPSELSRSDIRGRRLLLLTTNGTAVLHRLRTVEHVLVGCLRNASAVAAAAFRLATADGAAGDVQVVCAGRNDRFVLEDAVAAGVVVERLMDLAGADGREPILTDPAQAAIRLRSSYPDLLTAMQESSGGATLRRIGAPDDIDFCAEEDVSRTVPVFRDGSPMRIVRLESPGRIDR
ncbi:MAG: 2-phosphosulfolactate phosphatase [Candidatus Limnocylindrales bacterium]